MIQANLKKYREKNYDSNIINFMHNWNNKLDNVFFTTIRKPSVYNYYSSREGEIFKVLLKKSEYKQATLMDAELVQLENVTPMLLILDTGTIHYKKLFEKFKVYNKACLLLFKTL